MEDKNVLIVVLHAQQDIKIQHIFKILVRNTACIESQRIGQLINGESLKITMKMWIMIWLYTLKGLLKLQDYLNSILQIIITELYYF